MLARCVQVVQYVLLAVRGRVQASQYVVWVYVSGCAQVLRPACVLACVHAWGPIIRARSLTFCSQVSGALGG